MSASLVGSEMCIRDSPRPDPSCLAKASLHALKTRSVDPRRADCPCHAAVSYTHLTLPTICSV
eukprot:6249043-Alexandrium_andersonii.AAC.1